MPERRRAGLWVAGALAAAATGAGLFWAGSSRSKPSATAATTAGATPAAVESGELNGLSELSAINKGLQDGNTKAVLALRDRLADKEGQPRAGVPADEADAWLQTFGALRSGFLNFEPPARVLATSLTVELLGKFGLDPAPANWAEALKPAHDIFAAAFADADGSVRYAALENSSRFWAWMPGRAMTPAEEDALAEWKEAIHRPIVRCLASQDIPTRLGAVYSLGYLPIDDAAAPAMAYLDDPIPAVRRQVLISFTSRPSLLTVDMLLTRLHDSDDAIRDAATAALKVRGLSQELIGLGGLMTSPRADQRASVIALIKDRDDIDPVVWLLQLSRDQDEAVRIHAIEALAAREHQTATIKRRIVEMAKSDASEQVRQAASKLMPSPEETTAALPPLPGSPLLNPKAN